MAAKFPPEREAEIRRIIIAGYRIVPIRQIALAAGCCQTTVVHLINDLKAEGKIPTSEPARL